jgi:excisionase family DNA binding protein
MPDQKPIHNADVMSVEEIAEYLRISESTVWRLIKEGSIPYIDIGVRRFIFSKRRIDDWLYEISIAPKQHGKENSSDPCVKEIISIIRR